MCESLEVTNVTIDGRDMVAVPVGDGVVVVMEPSEGVNNGDSSTPNAC